MKRMMKRLAAIALAGAMTLSLSVTALASDITDLDNATGQATGTVNPPLTMPDDVIAIKMPTAAVNVFNLYFDPHNLIRTSNNALDLASAGVDGSAFATDTLVYFKNSGDTTKFTKTSDDIEIINKSNVPVSVEMTTTWTKGTGDTYTLSKDAAEFAAAKTAGEAAVSLVLKDTKNNSAYVVEKEKATPVMKWEATTADATDGATDQTAKVTAAKATIEDLIKDIKFEWTSAADAQDIKNINLGGTSPSIAPADWNFGFTLAAKKTPVVTFTNAANLPKYKSSNGTNVTETAYKSTASAAVTITEYKNTDESYTYSLPANATDANGIVKIQRGTTDVANIIIEWDYEALGELNKAEKETNYVVSSKVPHSTDANKYTTVGLKISAESGDGALVKTALNCVKDSYTLEKNSAGNALEWKIADAFSSDETKFQSLKFNLTAAITDSEDCIKAWDEAYKSSGGASMAVKWSVKACEAVDPSAEVTTEMASSGDSPVLKVDWGYGSKLASSITGGAFTNGNGGAGSIPASAFVVDDTDSSVITVNPGDFAAALWSGDGKVTLTFDTGATCVVALKAADAT